MKKIHALQNVNATSVELNGQDRVHVSCMGSVPSSGWSSFHLSPYYYLAPPPDGIWEFDFVGEPPHAPYFPILLPAIYDSIYVAPGWLKGIRVYSETNSIEDLISGDTRLQAISGEELLKSIGADFKNGRKTQFKHKLAEYEDSHQFTGGWCWNGWTNTPEMKKLKHTLYLVVEGPDPKEIKSCIESSVAIGLLVGIPTAFITGGSTLSFMLATFKASLIECLGDKFTVEFDNRSKWDYWCI